MAFNIRQLPSADEFRRSRFIRSRSEAFADESLRPIKAPIAHSLALGALLIPLKQLLDTFSFQYILRADGLISPILHLQDPGTGFQSHHRMPQARGNVQRHHRAIGRKFNRSRANTFQFIIKFPNQSASQTYNCLRCLLVPMDGHRATWFDGIQLTLVLADNYLYPSLSSGPRRPRVHLGSYAIAP